MERKRWGIQEHNKRRFWTGATERRRWGEGQRKKGGRELKARGAREGQKKMKRGSRETMCSAVDNYSRKLAEGTRERERQTERQANYNYF